MTRPVYTPLEDLLMQAPVRLLRALRRCDWVDSRDLFDLVIEAAPNEGAGLQSSERGGLSAALSRAVRSGHVERRPSANCWGRRTAGCYDVRITASGRAWLAAKLRPDTSVLWAPPRPGTEHLLLSDGAPL